MPPSAANAQRNGSKVQQLEREAALIQTTCSTNNNGGNTNNKLCHIDVADANQINTDNLQSGEGNATVQRCSEVNVKRATAHDYSATIPPLEKYA